MIPVTTPPLFQPVRIGSAEPGLGTARPTGDAAPEPELEGVLRTLPGGRQTFWGIPFDLEAPDAEDRWLWLSASAPARVLPVGDATARYVVVAHFCLPAVVSIGAAEPSGSTGKIVTPGERLATYSLRFSDGTRTEVPIRRRFEVNDAYLDYGHLPFAARPHRMPVLLDWRGPHGDMQWGRNQQTVDGPAYGRWNGWPANWWVHAVPNPRPDVPIREIRLEGVAGWVAVGGITLFAGSAHPLRHRPLETVRIVSSDGLPTDANGISVDLGMLGHRRWSLGSVTEDWVDAGVQGWGEPPVVAAGNEVMVELAATEDARLAVGERSLPLGAVYTDGEARSDDGVVRVERLPAPSNWVRVRVVDEATGRPTPARVHLRSADGRYLPPYGHRHEVNDRWFEDYGADCLLGSVPYAYVSGEFDVGLPAGEVLIEVVKGFDHRPVRRRVAIEPGQRELTLSVRRDHDHRSAGWITADTHVHFLSPETAWLEAQAEDINVVNLLATQWGDLYTNVGDYTGAPSGSSRDDTVVWVGTENRQHFLGHLNRLGIRGESIGRMCAGGPPESFIGDPLHATLAEWADRGHRERGLIVVPHFPVPYAEVVADVALGKVDGVELRDFGDGVDSFAVNEWYRLLNAGFRVAAVGGTDKMSAGMPLGGVRTYTRTGGGPVSFERWAHGVRAGRTITSTGPFIDLRVEGAGIGDELRIGGNGGTVTVEAEASAFQPLGRLEIVQDGRVVASACAGEDPTRIRLTTELRVQADGWIAARCDGPDTLWHTWTVRPAAHTSPVYVVGDARPERGPDLAFLQTIVEGGLTWLDTLATPVDAETHRRLRRTFLKASRVLGRARDPGSLDPPRSG
jgi:hypothetical protein